jgi:paraquat-inducible protein B
MPTMIETEPTDRPLPPPPQVARSRVGVSLVWLVPLAAALVALAMVIHGWLSMGPQILVSFETAEGLEANKTLVKYKNVVIGQVTQITLNEDRAKVLATLELHDDAEAFTRADTLYWVVRPHVGAHGVSGLDTLLSGAFIGADAGREEKREKRFVGLESPPPITYGLEGRRFTLQAPSLGSLEIGSPVYYRNIEVGQVISYTLTGDGKGVDIGLFVTSPNDAFVTTETRFWNASGIDLNLGADGLQLNTESLSSILAGGVSFIEPATSGATRPAADGTRFKLFEDRRSALTPPDGPGRPIHMRFDHPLRGLKADAPVEFLGINIGHVVSVELDYDPVTQRFPLQVAAVVYPRRLGMAHEKFVEHAGGEADEHSARLFKVFIEHGLRAQARSANLLTGQLYIALDFDPRAAPVSFDEQARPLVIPTTPGGLDKLQEQLLGITEKLSKLPLDSLARNMDASLAEMKSTLGQINGNLLPQMQQTLEHASQSLQNANAAISEDSPQRQQLGQAMEELQRTARSVRALTDYLARHPEALIRGRSEDSRAETYKARATSREPSQEPPP